uniref:PERQ amino acid-rich with GYF domain-containing protein 2 n=2 Tax=Schistocephalus solidus TaxID=70667 RepID=A0A0X3NQ32_SCHSO
MEGSHETKKFCYTRKQLITVRDSELVKENSDRFKIRESIISKNLPSRGRRKPIPLRTQDGQGDTPTATSESESLALPVDTSENKDNWRRAAAAPVSCLPSGHTESSEYVAPSSTRHNSGSSGTEETIVRPGGKEVDWTLGCGKWRHRSKSGSERGSRPIFGGIRGRGRGDISDGIPFTGGRGRGFVRRPYQPHNVRGKGFKPHNGYHQPESMDDFWHEGDWKHSAPVGPPFFVHHAQRPGVFDDVSLHPLPPSQPQTTAHEGNAPMINPPGIASDFTDQPLTDSVDGAAPKTSDPAPPFAPPGVRAPAVQTMWHYLDSEGQLQGPFDDATMASWFIAGHLPITLQVRRQCDKVFLPLSDFLARLGRFPFVDSHKLPPILEPQAPPPHFPAVAVSLNSPPPQSRPLSPPPPAPLPAAALDTPVLSSEPQMVIPASLPKTPPELEPKSLEAVNRPVLTFGDLSFMTEATLSEVKRLQENAKVLTDRASALGADNSNLAKHLESLTLNALQVVPDSPTVTKDLEELPLSKEPSSELNQVVKMTEQPCQSISEADPPAKRQVNLTTTPSEAPVTGNISPISEAPQQPVESGANPSALKKSKRSRKKAKQSEGSVEQTADVIKVEINKTITPAETPQVFPTVHEIVPEADWDMIIEGMDASTQPITAGHETSSTKKPKKKRKSKPTAEELRQKAWAQEEERRRQAAAERLAALDAEAARLAEERRKAELAYQAEVKKKEQAASQAALRAQKQREAEYTAAMSSMAAFNLPAAAKWGSVAGKSVTNASQPTPMVAILAEQTAEVMTASKAQAGAGTFAQKVAASSHSASTSKGQSASKKKTQTSPLSVDGPPSAPSNMSMPAPQSKTNPRNDPQSSQKSPPQTARSHNPHAVVSPTKSPVSIWDLPPNSSTMIGPPKKTSKKKKNNAQSQLLTGSAITLKPAARTELTHWCESQLSVFPRQDVDLPTLISLLCDIEEADDVLECIEASFGKSSRLSKFSKAFVEKRATLMRLTA